MKVCKLPFGLLLVWIACCPCQGSGRGDGHDGRVGSNQPAARQLLAVRGEVTKVASEQGGLVSITVRPPSDFAAVTVIAKEADPVGSAVGRDGGQDMLSLLGGDDSAGADKITAGEIQEGDVISVIYNPEVQNRALEIYMH